jgi:pSer/pThr/pTyr-binding forkhead associated (FHA) protein
MAKIILKIKDRTLREIVLHKDGVTTIGRNPSCDIHLENPAVSRSHAKIYREDWRFYVEDMGSSNGTFLNGARLSWKAGLTNKVSWKVALENNDKIIIAKYTLVFQDDRSDYEEVKTDKQDKTVIIKM